MKDPRPVVLVHGLWDTPKLFAPLVQRLAPRGVPCLTPALPHRFGAVSLRDLALQLDHFIHSHLGVHEIDLLGFSMGGVISRIWLQDLGGASRCRRFISLGSPQEGTFTAQWIPRWPLAGIAEMKRGSDLLVHLNAEAHKLDGVDCISLYSPWDLMVIPGWRAVLPAGEHKAIAVLTHRQLIRHPCALDTAVSCILRQNIQDSVGSGRGQS